tara:strand:- start:52 stop:1101 length:1050 start_codon:yes stop_codon:yes gene_type:complete
MALPPLSPEAISTLDEIGMDSNWWFKEFSKEFPSWYNIIKGDPELFGIVSEWWGKYGNQVGITPYQELYDSLMNSLKGSQWFLTQPDKLRDALILEATDPATYQYNLDENVRYAMDLTDTYLGTTYHSNFYQQLAKKALQNDWSDERFKREVITTARSGKWTTTSPASGRIKQTHDSIMDYAQKMLVPLGGKAWDLAWQISEGTRNIADAQDYVQGLAQARYGQWLDVRGLTEKGMTLDDVFEDQKNKIADTLELNPEDVHMWKMPIDTLFVEGSAGPLANLNVEEGSDSGVNLTEDLVHGEDVRSRRLMSIDDAEEWAKSRPRYQTTRNFRDGIIGLSGAMAQTMGIR